MLESEDDRKREREIIDVIAAKWGCEAKKCPFKNSFDYLMLREGIGKAIVEVRDRRPKTMEWFDAKGGYMISAYKIERCIAFSELARVPFFLAVRCADGLYTVKIIRESIPPPHCRLGFFDGNIDPRREEDKEPVFYIPCRAFRLFPDV